MIEQLAAEMAQHAEEQRNQLTDWFLANQSMKSKKLIALMQSWQRHPTSILRRLFWYHQAIYRDRCIKIGTDTGLHKDQMVAKNCTPSYLPEFIRIEVAKRE
jgi:hypothetical protein|tara:strand:+ start:19271 stop:19576 length:306 start_codon:yes stop_codon:yes gene_type:complete